MKRTFRTIVPVAVITVAGAFLLPVSPRAEVVGVVYPECCIAYQTALDSLKSELSAGGYGPAKAEIYEQTPSADPISWANAFKKFVGVDADLIIIFGPELLEIACREKTKIPVLFGFVDDPGEVKCVKSLDKPGKNVTGVRSRAPVFTLLENAKKVIEFKTLGAFNLQGNAVAASSVKEFESFAGELGFQVVPFQAKSRNKLGDALESAPSVDLIFFPNFSVGDDQLKKISSVAKQKKIPIVSLRPSETGIASLISLYPDPSEHGKLMGKMAVRILEGESPGKMKVETPKVIQMEVNMGMAKAMGLKVPMAVLESATIVQR